MSEESSPVSSEAVEWAQSTVSTLHYIDDCGVKKFPSQNSIKISRLPGSGFFCSLFMVTQSNGQTITENYISILRIDLNTVEIKQLMWDYHPSFFVSPKSCLRTSIKRNWFKFSCNSQAARGTKRKIHWQNAKYHPDSHPTFTSGVL